MGAGWDQEGKIRLRNTHHGGQLFTSHQLQKDLVESWDGKCTFEAIEFKWLGLVSKP